MRNCSTCWKRSVDSSRDTEFPVEMRVAKMFAVGRHLRNREPPPHRGRGNMNVFVVEAALSSRSAAWANRNVNERIHIGLLARNSTRSRGSSRFPPGCVQLDSCSGPRELEVRLGGTLTPPESRKFFP